VKIALLETWSTPEVCISRATADDGAHGWGQAAPYHAGITAEVFHRQVAPWALGQDVSTPERIGEVVALAYEREHKFPGSHMCRALGALDTALWDLHGRSAGKSVCQLLGGELRPLRAYASSMRRDISPDAEADRFARLWEQRGFDAFKFRVGSECGRDRDEWPGRTEEIVPAIRSALGEDADLLVDANSCYTPRRAIEVGRMLEDCRVKHFEEPCPYWEHGWTREVREALGIDVTGGEQDCDMNVWRSMLESRTVDVAQPDVCYVGGVGRFMRVAAMARDADIPVTPHSANLSMVVVFTAHLMCAIPNAGPYVEYSIEGEDYYPWQRGIYGPMPEVQDGKLIVPEGPGWGVEPDPRWLERADKRASAA